MSKYSTVVVKRFKNALKKYLVPGYQYVEYVNQKLKNRKMSDNWRPSFFLTITAPMIRMGVQSRARGGGHFK
jgi:hypothetical protein